MLLWGAFWGLVLGLWLSFAGRGFNEITPFIGAILGGLAAWTGRWVLQREWRKDWSAWLREQEASAVQQDISVLTALKAAQTERAAGVAQAASASQLRTTSEAQADPKADPKADPQASIGHFETMVNAQPAPQPVSHAPETAMSRATAAPPPKRRLLASHDPAAYLGAAPADISQLGLPDAATLGAAPAFASVSRAEPSPLNQALASLQAWLAGGNTVVRLGLLLLFIGLAFLAKYAAEAGLFPPALRMSFIAAVGVALFAAGWMVRGKYLQKLAALDGANPASPANRMLAYAHLLQGAGIAVLYLTVFAAVRLYALLPLGLALGLLVAIAALAAIIALLQNALAMAFIGFLGGFAAPILLSSGSGNYQALFSYYLLLDIAIVAIVWLRAWRPLNLLGFAASFGVMGWWVAQAYKPDMYASAQPFVLGFFVLFVLAALFYALRHGLPARRAVDASLLFGTPLAAMGIQLKLVDGMEYAGAFSALVASALYLALAAWMQGRAQAAAEPQAKQGARWLGQSYWALGLLFLTLAVPLGLDAQWTGAIWALEGAAVYHLGLRQGQWFPRAMGLALQPLALIAFVEQTGGSGNLGDVLHPQLLGFVCLAAGAWILVAGLQARAQFAVVLQAADEQLQGVSRLLARAVAQVEAWAAAPLFLAGCLYWLIGGYQQIELRQILPDGESYPWIGYEARAHALLLFSALSAFALHHWALPQRRFPLRVAAFPAWMLLPVMLVILAFDSVDLDIFTQMGGWWIWPLAVALWLIMLRRLDGSRENLRKTTWSWAHGGLVLLACCLLANALWWAVEEAQLWHTAWASVVFVVAGTAVLAYLARAPHFAALDDADAAAWPWQPYARVYLAPAAGLLAWVLGLGAVLLAATSRGNAYPLPYIPLLNPTDLSVLAALLIILRYRLRAAEFKEQALPRWELLALALAGFIWINTIWLRCVHHYWGVYWDGEALFDSFITQAGYSILWTLLALGAMLLAHRRAQHGL